MLCGFFFIDSARRLSGFEIIFRQAFRRICNPASKKVRPIKTGGFVIPLSINSILACCGLQIRKAKLG